MGASDLAAVLGAVDAAPARLGGVRLVAVDGPSGSGKSVFAGELVAALGPRAALVRTDDFATWDDPVSWWPRLADGVLTPLTHGHPGRYRRTEWSGGVPRPGEWITVGVPEVLVLEGVSAGRRSADPVRSLLVWVEMPGSAARLSRAVARDGEADRARLARWQEFEAGWFAVDGTRDRASIRLAR